MGIVTTVMEIAGVACVAVAGFLVLPALGFALTGLGLLALGWAMGRNA